MAFTRWGPVAASPRKPPAYNFRIGSKEHLSYPKVDSGDLIRSPWDPPKAGKSDFWSFLGDFFSEQILSPWELLDGLAYIPGGVPSDPTA